VPDLLNGQDGEIRDVGEEIERDDNECPEDQNSRQIPLRILDLSADEADVGLTVVDP